jgi:hypothetical protein
MLFDIVNGKPYLVSQGKAFAVKIQGGSEVTVGPEVKLKSLVGRYMLVEVVAKLGNDVSSVPEKRKRGI